MPDIPPLVPHKPKYNKPPKPTTTQQGYGWAHKKLRAVVLAEEPLCRICANAFSTDMDHIDGNPFNRSRENVQGLCESCHIKKTLGKL
jgi:5-methylcytosine-specific restriction endonuclease McrA